MKVFITGATGFIGRALAMRLLRENHELVAWVRSPARARALLGPDVALVDAAGGPEAMRSAIDGAQAIVHLAGESVARGRWTRRRREALIASRAGLGSQLVEAIGLSKSPPQVLASASAIGIYGDRGEQFLDETSVPGVDFLAELCRRWEGEAEQARAFGLRVARIRLGIVLGNEGGSLEKMLPAFRFGAGATLGSGAQFMSWIHLRDAVEVFARALEDRRYDGPINAVGPNPVTNREFTRALAAVLDRRARLRVPALALQLAFGEFASALLASQRVLPRRLYELGFHFEFREVRDALDDLLGSTGITIGPRRAESPRPFVESEGYLKKRPARYLLRQATYVEAPREEVFEFFSKAENLGAITPPSMGFRITDQTPGAMTTGTTIDYRLRVAGLPIRWRTRIEHHERGRLFVDAQTRGPYRSWWHEHRFEGEGSRTLMEDRVFYSPPLGLLGRGANRFFIAGALDRIFRYRRDVIRLRFGYRRLPAVATAMEPERAQREPRA